MKTGLYVLFGLGMLGLIVCQRSRLPDFPSYPEYPLCPSTRTDLIFAIPAGLRTPSNSFENHLISLTRYFTIGENNFRIGLLLYGTDTYTVISPTSFKNRKEVHSAITKASKRQLFVNEVGFSGQNYRKVIEAMKYEFERSDSGARKLGIFYSEGELANDFNEATNLRGLAQTMKDSGVVLYNIGSGIRGVSGYLFEGIGTDFCRLFGLGSFDDLTVLTRDLAAAICGEVDANVVIPTVIPPTTPGAEPRNDCFPQLYAYTPRAAIDCPTAGLFGDPENCFYFYNCPYYIRDVSNQYRTPCGDRTAFNGRVCVHECVGGVGVEGCVDGDSCPTLIT